MEAQPLNWVDAEAASLDRPPQPEEHGRGLADQPWRMVDLMGIAKPSPFTGVEKDWSEWRFRFEALLGLLGMRAAADQAAVADHPLRYEAYAEPLQKQAQLLQNILIHVCSGRAFGIVRGAPPGNGFEAWRQLVKEFEPALTSRKTALLNAILNPVWPEASFRDLLQAWERLIAQYELLQGKELADDVKCAVVFKAVPGRYRDVLRMAPGDIATSFCALKKVLTNYWDRTRVCEVDPSTSDSIPMETDVGQGPYEGHHPGHDAPKREEQRKG